MEHSDIKHSGSEPYRYKCGLVVGEVIHLIKPLEIRYSGTDILVEIEQPSRNWHVLPPSINVATGAPDTSVVWLLRPDGDRHVWNDNADEVFEYFER